MKYLIFIASLIVFLVQSDDNKRTKRNIQRHVQMSFVNYVLEIMGMVLEQFVMNVKSIIY